MRQIASALFALTLVATPSAQSQDATGAPVSDIRVATVDSIKLDQGYIVLVKHREVIQAKKAQVDATAKAMAEAAKPIADRVRAIQAELADPISEEAKRAKYAEYTSLAQELQKKDQEIKAYAAAEYKKLTDEGQAEKTQLLTSVRDVIAKICKERGISLVLEHSSLEGRAQVVWFSKPEMDLTNDVLAILNASQIAPPEGGTSTTPPAIPAPGTSSGTTTPAPIPAVPIE